MSNSKSPSPNLKSPFTFDFPSYPQPTRGEVIVFEDKLFTFPIRRVFWIRDVPPDAVRGDHANARTNKIIVAISGSVEISTTDSNAQIAHFTLNSPRQGLYVPHHFVNRMRNFAPGTVILVLADQPYDPQELIPSESLSVN